MRVMRDLVLVEADTPPEKTASGLFIVEEWKSVPPLGTVLEVGPQVTEVKKGDRVVFERYGSIIMAEKNHRMCKEGHILAIITNE